MIDQEYNRFYWFITNIRKSIGKGLKTLITQRKALAVVLLIVMLYLLVVGRASYQPVILLIRKYALLVVLLIGVLWWWFRVIRSRSFKSSILPTVLLLIILVLGRLAGPPIHKYCSLYFQYRVLNKVELTGLGQTDFERIQPLRSIKTLVNQEALSETEDATPPRFIRGHDGRYYFSMAVGPAKGYKIQQLSKNMYEVLFVPANLPSPVFGEKYRKTVDFNIGELLLFSKKTKYSVTRKFDFMQFFSCEAGKPLYLPDDNNNWKQVVPIIQWKGWLFPRPVFCGVTVIDEVRSDDSWFKRVVFGKGNFISAAQIKNHKYLTGQNLIPTEVADYVAESFRFANGFLAPMPGYHEGDIRIPRQANDGASQPFVAYFENATSSGIYNYYGLEPYQEDKKGLSLSVLIPGDDASHVYFLDHRNSGTSLIGSSAIRAKIIESRKNYDWTENYPAESRPFIRTVDGITRFFWLSTIVTRAGSKEGAYIGGSIPEITLTDAIYGKVVWIDTDSIANTEAWVRQAKGELHDYWEDEN